MAYTDQEKQKWVEIAQDTGSSIERGAPVLTLGELDTTVSIPGVKFSSITYDEDGNAVGFGNPETYAQLPLGTLAIKTKAASDAADAANTAAARANTASDGAEKVDATLVGMTVTITNRQGVSHSQNIGFEIYRTYPSVAAMNADAANVMQGQFVMIATTNPTDPDNAQLWGRNDQPATSQNPFTFLSDLDQASSAAWADWLNNMKPEIVAAINAANTAADRVDAVIIVANSDHTRAESDHTTASSDHTTAQSDHNRANTDHSTAVEDHSQAEADTSRADTDHSTALSDHTTAVGDTARAATDHNTAVSDHTQAASDTTMAGQDHSTAQSDHSTATTDHSTAQSDHTAATNATAAANNATTAANNAATYANNQGNYSKNMADHPAYIGEDNYWYIWNYAQQKYVKSSYAKGDDLDWDSMTEEEKQALADEVLSRIAFDSKPTSGSSNAVTSGGIYTALGNREKIIEASVATSQSIVDELT